jgi:hypothetical protein
MFFSLALLISSSTAQSCNVNGTAVKVQGYVMDNFCIDRGNLFDNPSVKTLVNPGVHSIHCLVDVPDCVESLYAVLAAPSSTNGMYSVKYQLGKDGSMQAYDAAQTARKNGQTSGFTAEFAGVDDGTTELKCAKLLSNGAVNSAATTTKAAASSPTNLAGNGASDVWRSAGGVAAVAVLAML